MWNMNKHNYSKSGWLKHVMSSTLSVLVVALAVAATGCAQKEAPVELEIPAHFITYTDEVGLFSISYPPEWELIPETGTLEQTVKEFMQNLERDLPLERVSLIFVAGVPCGEGHDPNVCIYVELLPGGAGTLDEVVDAAIQESKSFLQDYREFSRVRITVNGKQAIVEDSEAYVPNLGKNRWLTMHILAGRVYWNISCCTTPQKFGGYEDDFHTIVRSLRIFR